jgi:maltose alpha-D-glucosyltransferase/alpha-amylase
MIRLRKQCPEIGWGDWRIVATGARSVLAIEYRWRGSTIICIHNLAADPCEASLRVDGETLSNLIDEEDLRPDRRGTYRIPLEPYGYRWLRCGELNQALARDVVG